MTNSYYQKHKEKLQKEACEGYQNHSKEKTLKVIKSPRKISKFK